MSILEQANNIILAYSFGALRDEKLLQDAEKAVAEMNMQAAYNALHANLDVFKAKHSPSKQEWYPRAE